jgi:hypothetical protein
MGDRPSTPEPLKQDGTLQYAIIHGVQNEDGYESLHFINKDSTRYGFWPQLANDTAKTLSASEMEPTLPHQYLELGVQGLLCRQCPEDMCYEEPERSGLDSSKTVVNG